MNFEDYQRMDFERDGNILRVTFNQPQALNAIDERLHYELSILFNEITLDPETEVVILTGAGRAFCAGANLDWLEDLRADPRLFDASTQEGKRILFGMLECPKPVVCRLNGDAVGLGASIALLCDIIVAADTARIADPHVNVGLVTGDGGAVIWPQLIGYAKAKEFLLTGKFASAEEAERIGLVNYCLPAEELDDKVNEIARTLSKGALTAIKYTKTVINLSLKQIANNVTDAAFAYECLTGRHPDHGEGLAAFREKRRPNFPGD